MRAIQYSLYGDGEVIKVVENVPEPLPQKDQVLVDVHAASINPIDYKVRSGYFKGMTPLHFPVVPGGDFSGIVKKVGDGVLAFKPGDQVYGFAIVLAGGSGSFAEAAVSNANNTALKPKNADFLQAAALPLTGTSALQGLEDHLRLKNGQKILIHGGAGGIGSIAIQLAKLKGAYVATTVSEKNISFVKELGADLIIDRQHQLFETIVKDYDAVFDTVGGDISTTSILVLKKGGILVSMVGQPDKAIAEKHGVTVIGQMTATDAKHLNRLSELFESGKIRVFTDKVFSLEQAKDAFKHAEQGHPRGKVVLKIK
jgi:alcohol dehydrogenase